MKKFLPVTELARDERFSWISEGERFRDPRNGLQASNGSYQRPSKMGHLGDDAPERARSLMHGIFMGEVQALEAAGRTCWDFEVGGADGEAPFALKLDMARQCWDESRHVEISVKLGEWMGSEIGEFAEGRGLYQAGCNPDPALRLCAVNRGIEGLAIDVFANMKAFGTDCDDPVMTFCEDWMLADEVTHVKMGSDWLRRLTADDPERRKRALEFQRLVDKVFSAAGRSGDGDAEGARAYRKMAGFTDDDIDEGLVPLPADEDKAARRRLVEGSLPARP
ncbi:MAG: hypothetical protein QOF60_1230 [Actinomycetota bacterium]|jgi:uncharacterized ferritin-like protein (DUF455 family)|nr:hypothetical protein [Actinomycetota bacterium]